MRRAPFRPGVFQFTGCVLSPACCIRRADQTLFSALILKAAWHARSPDKPLYAAGYGPASTSGIETGSSPIPLSDFKPMPPEIPGIETEPSLIPPSDFKPMPPAIPGIETGGP